MTSRLSEGLRFSCTVAIGLVVSTGTPFGLVAAAAMPIVCLSAGNRVAAAFSTLAYYAACLWPMMPGLWRYLHHSPVIVAIWLLATVLLSVPWMLAWTNGNRLHYVWRVLLAEAAITFPPLGFIGFLSPLVGAGFLFPNTAWLGIAATALLPGFVLALLNASGRARFVIAFVLGVEIAVGIAAQVHEPEEAQRPSNWEAVNTHFGNVSEPIAEYRAAESIQQHVTASSARVIIFPEFVVPRWTLTSAEFWHRTLLDCRTKNQIVVLGAGVPLTNADPHAAELIQSDDFDAAIQTLRMNGQTLRSQARLIPSNSHRQPFENTLLIFEEKAVMFYQRVPVPIGMWNPLDPNSVPIHLNAPGTVEIDGQRVAPLICYEQLITYPVLASLIDHPTILVGISNMYWFEGDSIAAYQQSALRAWAKLFHLPYLSATNN